MSNVRDNSGSEFFYIDENGRKTDAGLHDDEPGDPEAYAELAIKSAIARGVSPEDARQRYGVQSKPLSKILPRG